MSYGYQKVSNPPLGSYPVYADNVSGKQAQIIKLDKGTEGLSSPITDANPLPVTVTAPVTIGASIDINSLPNEGQQTMANSISVAIASNQSAVPVANTPSEYTIRMEEQSTYSYFGFALPSAVTSSAVWKVKRLTNADNTILFADGNANFDNIWDNRGSLTYN